jgi:hypothetical protein
MEEGIGVVITRDDDKHDSSSDVWLMEPSIADACSRSLRSLDPICASRSTASLGEVLFILFLFVLIWMP